MDRALRRMLELAVVATASMVIWHEVRIGVIESNRFTSKDWQLQAEPIRQGIQEILESQSAVVTRIDYIIERQRENSADIDALEEKIGAAGKFESNDWVAQAKELAKG